MTVIVEVSDRGSPQQKRHDCIEWLITTWCGITWDVYGSNEKRSGYYDVSIFRGFGRDYYEFKDDNKALLFKLVWG